jgi:ElaB/YqjD/DUF883 family membrane-anchored ribosome-binding protein
MASTGREFGGTEHPEQQTSRISTATGGQSSRGEEGTLGSMTTAVKEKAQELASTVTSRAEEAWDTTKQTAQQAASAVVRRAENTWEEVAGVMRRYPVATFCVGIGIGFLLSQLVKNRETLEPGRRNWQA